jgi:hypothetical protein
MQSVNGILIFSNQRASEPIYLCFGTLISEHGRADCCCDRTAFSAARCPCWLGTTRPICARWASLFQRRCCSRATRWLDRNRVVLRSGVSRWHEPDMPGSMRDVWSQGQRGGAYGGSDVHFFDPKQTCYGLPKTASDPRIKSISVLASRPSVEVTIEKLCRR